MDSKEEKKKKMTSKINFYNIFLGRQEHKKCHNGKEPSRNIFRQTPLF